jgi:hypothetical protein
VRQGDGQVLGEGAFADTAFVVHGRNDHAVGDVWLLGGFRDLFKVKLKDLKW